MDKKNRPFNLFIRLLLIILSALLAAGGIILATLLVFPLITWLEYLRILNDPGSLSDLYGIVARDMFNLRTAIVLLFGESGFPIAHILNLVAFLVSFSIILVLIIRSYREGSGIPLDPEAAS